VRVTGLVINVVLMTCRMRCRGVPRGIGNSRQGVPSRRLALSGRCTPVRTPIRGDIRRHAPTPPGKMPMESEFTLALDDIPQHCPSGFADCVAIPETRNLRLPPPTGGVWRPLQRGGHH
jgi:hypothetical protein